MLTPLPLVVVLAAVAAPADAETAADADAATRIGLKFRGGGRYDDVRMCVATPAGVKGGLVGDLSFLAEFPVGRGRVLHVDLPVGRPIVFGVANQMLQFEPSIGLLFRSPVAPRVHLVGGPVLGVSLHYGPDFNSEPDGDGRTADFFAAGPIIGAYGGLDFPRPTRVFNFQLGLTPYVETLWRADGGGGIVVGGTLDLSFRFAVRRRRGRGRNRQSETRRPNLATR